MTAARLNEQKQIIYIKQSDIQKISLSRGEEVTVMSFDKEQEYPIIISANILYITPEEEQTQTDQTVSAPACSPVDWANNGLYILPTWVLG